MTDRVYTACLLIIGNEILSGRTQDANLPYLAKRLNELGIRLKEARVVADDEAAIVEAVNETRALYDYVFTTGGIGPTHDDITSGSVAKAFGTALERNAEAVRRLERHYPPGGLNEARLRMAEVPVGATLIDNPVSTAPGFRIGNVFVLAGVPRIMQAMFEGIAPGLVGGKPVMTRSVSCTLGEGVLAKGLGEIQARHQQVDIGSYPYYRVGGFGVSLVARGTDAGELAAVVDEIAALVTGLGATPQFDQTG
ncbi:MAG: molybdopterin-binding protein [Alphaproteobacteria bacterium]|nr:molybdopterin-binding protein [Alphaproteobacteria bacterium]